jgi:hypothetical protein
MIWLSVIVSDWIERTDVAFGAALASKHVEAKQPEISSIAGI